MGKDRILTMVVLPRFLLEASPAALGLRLLDMVACVGGMGYFLRGVFIGIFLYLSPGQDSMWESDGSLRSMGMNMDDGLRGLMSRWSRVGGCLGVVGGCVLTIP